MKHSAVVAHTADVAGWRKAAREAIALNARPDDVVWTVNGAQNDILAATSASAAPLAFKVSRRFVDLAAEVLLHRDPERFALMYRLLWRIREQPELLNDVVDPDVWRATRMAKVVHRDIHKMHAFVRFKEVQDNDATLWLAWFEPDHHILEAATPHFVDRFTSMQWSILTPERSATWNKTDLIFGPGGTRSAVPQTDRLDEHWRTYYRSIFNPARLKIGAMTKEMPKKYWRNLPEATEIPDLIRIADGRMQNMVAADATAPSPMTAVENRKRLVAEPAYLPTLSTEISACVRCPIGALATQAVLGEGPTTADVMIVGEQPGDQEDLVGRPFIGPAGKVLDSALADAGLDRLSAYVTNAVKHFKFEPRGKRRIHKSPSAGEVDHCRWWLARERATVRPKLIIALGASAARGVLGRAVTIGQVRGQVIPLEDGAHLLVTVHPSYLLRLQDEPARRSETDRFIADLTQAKQWLAQTA